MPPDLEPPPSPRAFKVTANDGALPNDLAIRSTFAKLGAVKSLHRIADGVVVTLSTKDSAQALAVSSIIDIPVICAEATSSKGTIYLGDFSSCSDAEIKEELPEGAKFMRRLPSRGADVNSSARILLEFNKLVPPEFITLLCGLRVEVRRHTPAPLRCRRCLAYGHHERTCSKEPRCSNCSGTGHVDGDCKANPKCQACGGPHAVTSTACRIWQKEMELNKIRISRNCSSSEARKLLNKRASTFPPLSTAAPGTAAPGPAPAPSQSWASLAAGTTTSTRSHRQSPAQNDLQAQMWALMQQQFKMMENQICMLNELKKQNELILSLLSGQSNVALPSSSTSSGRTLRQRKTAVTPATSASSSSSTQRKLPQLIIQQQSPLQSPSTPQSPKVISLGRDTIASPSAPNVATFDFIEKN